MVDRREGIMTLDQNLYHSCFQNDDASLQVNPKIDFVWSGFPQKNYDVKISEKNVYVD